MSAVNSNNPNIREFVWKIDSQNKTPKKASPAPAPEFKMEAKMEKELATIKQETREQTTTNLNANENMLQHLSQTLEALLLPLMEKMTKLEQHIKVLRAENTALQELIHDLGQANYAPFAQDDFLHIG